MSQVDIVKVESHQAITVTEDHLLQTSSSIPADSKTANREGITPTNFTDTYGMYSTDTYEMYSPAMFEPIGNNIFLKIPLDP